MQKTPGRRAPASGSSFFEKVVAALRGRAGMLAPHRSFRARRAVPLMAVGALAAIAFEGWTPGVVSPRTTTRVDGVPSAAAQLPVEVNARVEKWMQRFMTDQKGTFQTFLSREGIYAGMIRAKLRERAMPEDLLYLAMMESGFSARATSPVAAAGVWQFMGPTARQYGLRVDRWVDERRDPVKATDAALDYLEFLHDRYGSWYLAAAAYNAGPGRVDRILKRHANGRTGEEALYWEIIDHLPRETRDYVPKILAATTLARQAERYGFEVKGGATPYEFDRVWVPGGTSLTAVAKALTLSPALLKELNPHLVRGATPPGSSYGLRVPKGSSESVIAALGGRLTGRMAE